MKEAYYFSHDTNARHDPKILSMRSVYGMEGYGMYWAIVEMLREQEGYKLEITKYLWNAIAMQIQIDHNATRKFIDDCINEFNLFKTDGTYLWSESLLKRMEAKNEKTERLKQAGKKGAKSRWNDGENGNENSHPNGGAIATLKNENSHPMALKESKVKEKKVKESKEKEIKETENIASSSCVVPEWDARKKNVFEVYQSEIGVLTPFIAESIEHWISDLSEEIVIKALKISVANNVRNWSYAQTILKNWASKNLKTIEQVNAHELEFAIKKQGGDSSGEHVNPASKTAKTSSFTGKGGRIRHNPKV